MFANVFERVDVDSVLIHFAEFCTDLLDAFEKRICRRAFLVELAFERETSKCLASGGQPCGGRRAGGRGSCRHDVGGVR